MLIVFLLRFKRRTANRAEHASAELSMLVEFPRILKFHRAGLAGETRRCFIENSMLGLHVTTQEEG